MFLARKRNITTGIMNEMPINATVREYELWRRGKLIQDAMPNATATQREFLLSGMTEKEQAIFYGETEK